MTGHEVDRSITRLQEHVEALRQHVGAGHQVAQAVLPEVFEHLLNALEELRIADEELRQQNEELALTRRGVEVERARYQELFEFAPDGYLVTDAVAVIREANRAVERLLGVRCNWLVGKPLTVFVPAGQRQAFLIQLARLVQQDRAQDWEVLMQPRKGAAFHAALTVATVRDFQGRPSALRWLIRDITPRKMVEAEAREAGQALRSSQEQLRDLATHLQQRQEEERRLIAREIHDELGQVLSVLKIDLSWLSEHLVRSSKTVRARLSEMALLLDTLVSSVRRIGTELRPHILDDLGLFAAIEWQLQEIRRRTGIAYELSLPRQEVSLPEAQATALFRIFQEALTNVMRHAKANRVNVRIVHDADTLLLEVTDNGRGITSEQLMDRTSLGLLGMQERARLWNGHVTIQGKPGKGTTVNVRVPYTPSGTRGDC